MSDVRAGPLSPERPELGTASLIPWDSDHFGFPVGTWATPLQGLAGADPTIVNQAVSAWAECTGARLVSASVPATDFASVFTLQAAGFRIVDCSLAVRHPRLHAAGFTLPDLPVRPASPNDRDAVIRIASTAFAFGRYHTDPWFPRALANRRYARWVDSALGGGDPRAVVLVTGAIGDPTGFFYAQLVPPVAKLLLAGVATAFRGGPIGVGLYVGALLALRDRGARVAESVIATANIDVVNLYSTLGFRFGSPTVVLHRHTGRVEADSVQGDIPEVHPSRLISALG